MTFFVLYLLDNFDNNLTLKNANKR